MNDITQGLYRERIDCIVNEIIDNADDVTHALRKIKQQLYGNYGEASFGTNYWGKKYTPNDLITWLHFGREEVGESLMYLQSLIELIDEIEDKVNKDEVNRAEG